MNCPIKSATISSLQNCITVLKLTTKHQQSINELEELLRIATELPDKYALKPMDEAAKTGEWIEVVEWLDDDDLPEWAPDRLIVKFRDGRWHSVNDWWCDRVFDGWYYRPLLPPGGDTK